MATLAQSSNAGGGTGSSATLSVSLTGVAAGDLVVIPCKFEGAATTVSSASAGTSSLTVRPIQSHTGNNDLHTLIAYLLAANSGDRTYTITLAAARPWRSCHAYQVNGTGTWVFDDQGDTAGASTGAEVIESAPFDFTGTDGIAIGVYGEHSGAVVNAETINGVTGDGVLVNAAGNFTRTWHKLLSAGFTGGTAGASIDNAADYIMSGISFKLTAGGGSKLLVATNNILFG